MTITEIGQAIHRQTLRIGLSGGRKRFDVTAETLSRFA
ncbi:hypothetical protein HNQ36_001115 [Afipia massiliensis]|uniref:Uncharacterized protein n=1 Tax=Afipia massiliensis TaxID=211460 RepID=A0A840MZX3_9BRAD|nr:hypothetical protein [Afipia massiliensis]